MLELFKFLKAYREYKKYCFERCLLLSTNGNGHSDPLVNQTFKSCFHKVRYFYQQDKSSLFSLVYTLVDTPPHLAYTSHGCNILIFTKIKKFAFIACHCIVCAFGFVLNLFCLFCWKENRKKF